MTVNERWERSLTALTAELLAENEQLRAALKKILTYAAADRFTTAGGPAKAKRNIREIATAALEGK
jgi:hypothetical protein